MPRRRRALLPDTALHLVQRANNGIACFVGDTDRLVFLDLLATLLAAHAIELHAFCLMTNHVHLLATPSAPNTVSTMMRSLGQRYAQYFNRRHARTGTLWDGRFRSTPVQTRHYVLACYRYIEMNPVRAALVSRPESYPWSSYRANAEGREVPWLTPHVEYVALGSDGASRREAYRALAGSPPSESELRTIRESTRAGLALGDAAFRAYMTAEVGMPMAACERGRPQIAP
jgi:putative transposase